MENYKLNNPDKKNKEIFERKVEQLLISKNLPKELVEYGIKLLPEMINIFGKEKILKLLNEYEIKIRYEHNINSGSTIREKKIIEFDWVCKNLHEALILYIHEAGHAIGELEANPDSFLMEGHKFRESFLRKIEEAVVSERQNELEYGELNYSYLFNSTNFKTQGDKYGINNVFLKNIQILLGKKRDLIQKMMYANTLEEKNTLCNRCINLIKEQLSNEEFLKLKDCINVFNLNYDYSSNTCTLENYMKDEKNFDEKMPKETYKKLLVKFFPKNIRYSICRDLLNKNILDAVDDLCEITLNILLKRLSNPEYNNFSALQEGCEYFTKIYNISENLSQQTAELKVVIENELNKKVPSLISSLSQKGFDEKETFKILTSILSKKDLQEEDLPKITIDENNEIKILGSNITTYKITELPKKLYETNELNR